MNLKSMSIFILAGAVAWVPAAVLAETLPASALDREVTSREDSMGWNRQVTDPPKWQPAKLPANVIPSVKPIEGPRNQKIRTMVNMTPIDEKHKFHKAFTTPAVKVHPIAVKTVKIVPEPHPKPHPKPIRKE